jgi:hypothetical protein
MAQPVTPTLISFRVCIPWGAQTFRRLSGREALSISVTGFQAEGLKISDYFKKAS